MNSSSVKRLALLLQIICLSLIAAGCATKPKPVAWNLNITKPAAVEVDLVAVTVREKPRLEGYSMDAYWSPGDPERKGADKQSAPPSTNSWTITRKDAVWTPMMKRNVVGLFVIANLPGKFESGVDPRREFLPLDKNHWNAKRDTLEIKVQENRIIIITPENLPK